jgi:hypothetical protein
MSCFGPAKAYKHKVLVVMRGRAGLNTMHVTLRNEKPATFPQLIDPNGNPQMECSSNPGFDKDAKTTDWVLAELAYNVKVSSQKVTQFAWCVFAYMKWVPWAIRA